jgi:hypothetical protein
VSSRTLGLGLLLSLALLPGCLPSPGVTPDQVRSLRSDLLGFLKEGVTSRQEALLHLGTPLGRFEGDRILTWDFRPAGEGRWERMPSNGAGSWPVATYAGSTTCSLVLVFDDAGILQRHSLVHMERLPEPVDRPASPQADP